MVLEGPVRTPDGSGGFVDSWTPLGEHWVELQAGIGRERNQEFGSISAVHYRIHLRASPVGAVSRPRADQRFRQGTRVFRIVAVAEHAKDTRYLTCFAYEEEAS